jgi:lipopolysaccharide export system protein LptC
MPDAARARTTDDTGPGGSQAAESATPRQPPRLSGRNSYSLFVAFLKLFLPALAVALILLVIVWPQLDIGEEQFRVGVSKLEPESGENVSMLNARFQGVDDKGQPYTLTADVASQKKADSNDVELEFPRGEINLDDGRRVLIDARNGLYRRDTQLLELEGGVNVFHEDGYRLMTDTALVDLENGVAVSEDPTRTEATFGEVDSEGIEITQDGDRIFFTGKARLLVYPRSSERDVTAPSRGGEAVEDAAGGGGVTGEEGDTE